MKKRSLYDCSHAKYPVPLNEYIMCSKGHKLGSGKVHKRQVDREYTLIFKICQLCTDFDDMDLTNEEKQNIMEVQ